MQSRYHLINLQRLQSQQTTQSKVRVIHSRERKWELEFKQFYTKDFTPLVEFGKLLFSEWSQEEWCIFDNYMVENLMFYLKNGFIKI